MLSFVGVSLYRRNIIDMRMVGVLADGWWIAHRTRHIWRQSSYNRTHSLTNFNLNLSRSYFVIIVVIARILATEIRRQSMQSFTFLFLFLKKKNLIN